MITTDKEELSYWISVKLGDIIQLTDEQTIGYLMEEGYEHLSHGADFTVNRKREITAHEGRTKWLILDIEYGVFTWYLIVKSNGLDFDLYLYYIPEGFVDGDRNDIINNSDWLMEVWEDGMELKDLPFAKEIQQGEGILFKTDGPRYGTFVEDRDKSFATIMEYSCDAEGEKNPLLIALELNNAEGWEESEESLSVDDYGDIKVEVTTEEGVTINEDSSYIILLQGCKIAIGDIDVLRT